MHGRELGVNIFHPNDQVQYKVVSGDVIIAEMHVKHKFADPVEVGGCSTGHSSGPITLLLLCLIRV